MVGKDPDKVPDYIALEISTDEDSKHTDSDSDDENTPSQFKKQKSIHSGEYVQKYRISSSKINDGILSHCSCSKNSMKNENAEAAAQTDTLEKTVATQADMVPKIYCFQSQSNQFVQTDHQENNCECYEQDCCSIGSDFACNSNSTGSLKDPFTKVYTLSCIPTTLKHHKDYVGNLEEKAFKVSRWLEECSDVSDSDSEIECFEAAAQTDNPSKTVRFKDNDDSNLLLHQQLHRNAVVQTDPISENNCTDFVHEYDSSKHADHHAKGRQKINFQNALEQSNSYFKNIDYDMFDKAVEVKRELLSKARANQRFSEIAEEDDLINANCYKPAHQSQNNPSPEKENEQFIKPEPVRVRKRFSNYLKDQYRSLTDEAMGKSYMMMQDLKEVLQKRGIAN
ncbi:uncharacterized protein TNCV_2504691 [Trichonephila clavipes]|uniref:Uncharacterized protein n=1 Tax=Trichonephila clavipes TaxID=2585209 RepID=A0A8X6WHU3_TRICX|nr:uncharacterized protein TNCV_2504691 [Trichonephila clavipes]